MTRQIGYMVCEDGAERSWLVEDQEQEDVATTAERQALDAALALKRANPDAVVSIVVVGFDDAEEPTASDAEYRRLVEAPHTTAGVRRDLAGLRP